MVVAGNNWSRRRRIDSILEIWGNPSSTQKRGNVYREEGEIWSPVFVSLGCLLQAGLATKCRKTRTAQRWVKKRESLSSSSCLDGCKMNEGLAKPNLLQIPSIVLSHYLMRKSFLINIVLELPFLPSLNFVTTVFWKSYQQNKQKWRATRKSS